MKIQNEQFGEIEYENTQIFKFEEGILGFEELTDFLLFAEKDSYFYWLTSISEPEIVFPVLSINLLQEEYVKEGEFEPFGIVKLDKEPQNITINLKAPVFINQKDKTGFQKIVDNVEYQVDYPLFAKK
jgi:flagellar assembly factor FliW